MYGYETNNYNMPTFYVFQLAETSAVSHYHENELKQLKAGGKRR